MRWESRFRHETERSVALRAALAASLAVSLLAMALLPPFPTLAASSPPPAPARLVTIPEVVEPPEPRPVPPPRIPLEVLDEDAADLETLPDTVPDPGTPPALSSVVPSRPFRVLEKVPRPRRYTQPRYPEIARQAGVEGAVVVRATVDRNGRVVEAAVVSSDSAMLDEAALEAVRAWTFHPAEQSGVPVRAVVSVRLEFRLR